MAVVRAMVVIGSGEGDGGSGEGDGGIGEGDGGSGEDDGGSGEGDHVVVVRVIMW